MNYRRDFLRDGKLARIILQTLAHQLMPSSKGLTVQRENDQGGTKYSEGNKSYSNAMILGRWFQQLSRSRLPHSLGGHARPKDGNMDRVIIVQIREDDELLMMAYGCRL